MCPPGTQEKAANRIRRLHISIICSPLFFLFDKLYPSSCGSSPPQDSRTIFKLGFTSRPPATFPRISDMNIFILFFTQIVSQFLVKFHLDYPENIYTNICCNRPFLNSFHAESSACILLITSSIEDKHSAILHCSLTSIGNLIFIFDSSFA